MNKRLARWRLAILAGPLLGALAGCTAATTRAPVVERSTGAAATTAEPAAPAPAPAASYTVRKNDTLYSIAWRHNLDYKTLAAANRIEPPYTIYPGRRLSLPGPGVAQSATTPAPAAAATPPVANRDAPPVPRPVETSPAVRQPAPRPAVRGNKDTAPAQAPARPTAVAAATKPPPTLPAKPKATATASPPRPAAPKPQSRPPTSKPPAASGGWRPPVAAKPTRRFGGTSKGYDYALPPATTVRAAAPGEVVYAGPGLGGFRHLVIVKASERYLVAYGINVAPKLREGETVALGAPVAEIGSGGSAAGRFHFEIRDRGKPVDPGPLLGGA